MNIEIWVLAAIFAPLLVTFIVAIVSLLWRQSSIPARVKRLEETMDELREDSKRMASLETQVLGLSERVDREAQRDARDHEALAQGIQAVTNHLLDIKRMNGSARAKR